MSEYDEVIDRGVSDVHAHITAFALRMEAESGKPDGAYEANAGFYADTRGAVASLKLRARAREKNESTVKLLDDLDHLLEDLGRLHEMGKERGLRRAVASPALQSIDVTCESLIKFEIAKRRGRTTE